MSERGWKREVASRELAGMFAWAKLRCDGLAGAHTVDSLDTGFCALRMNTRQYNLPIFFALYLSGGNGFGEQGKRSQRRSASKDASLFYG